jgi:hypothetical protein
MKRLLSVLAGFSFLACSIYEYPEQSPMIEFATNAINKAVSENGIDSPKVTFKLGSLMLEQAFRIKRTTKNKYVIFGGDETGLMYGGLELAEIISINRSLPLLEIPIEEQPFVKQRGLKFNIPLDIRTPSYQDAGDAAQNNILEMWNIEFWKSYIDMMARNRYNVLTLWNPHPFPSMIKMENYPDIALQNVCGTSFPLDTDRPDEPVAKFIAGSGISKDVLDNLVVLKEMTIEEKIDYWREVMLYAKNRGVDVYFITWNIWMNSIAPPGWYREQKNKKGDETGLYGINNDQENPHTIAYLREAVKEFILTYPDLAGLGLTAGENMENRDDEFDRQKWLWATYGEGVLDAKKVDPGREVKFIHRYWQSDVRKIVDDFFSKYPDEINLGFKYARARMYANPAPRWADALIDEYRPFGLKCWWNIRNDDIFHFRWGNPEYASSFIKNLPPEDVTAGYYMGSDGYVWGREFISKHPKDPRELEIDKHWYNFMLWGRMGYNPNMDRGRVKGLLALKYPGVPVDMLYDVWALASDIPSYVTSFHWNSWDFMWAVEGCLSLREGFHTVDRFINNPTMDRSGLITIPEYVSCILDNRTPSGTTPTEHANRLDSQADRVKLTLDSLMKLEGEVSDSFDELLYDIKAWAYMGKYYAAKIHGASNLHAYRSGLGMDYQSRAVANLEHALNMWKEYAAAATRNYRPQFMAKTRTIDWDALTEDVARDIEIAQQ